MGELFYLDFKSDGFGKVEINEPVGYNDIIFGLNQKPKLYARDESFIGDDKLTLDFVNYRDHYLPQLLYYNHYFGFEAKVNVIITLGNGIKTTYQLDFASAITDDLTYFKCTGIVQSDYQIIKRRKAVKVDLLSSTDIDGNVITPLIPSNILLLAKPVVQTSKWEQINKSAGNRKFAVEYINPCTGLMKYGIEDTSTFYQSESNNSLDFKVLKAKNKLRNVKVSLKEITIEIPPRPSGGEFSIRFFVIVADDNGLNVTFSKIFINKTLEVGAGYSFSANSFTCEIPEIQREQSLYIFFRLEYNGVTTPGFYHDISLKNMDITAESIAYSSVTPSFRLVDVMAQVVKSIAGLNITAPRFANGGQFFDNRLFNGNFLRGIKDKSFYVSLEDLEKSITEMNADYEIQSDGRIFFGIEADFYRTVECGFFDNTQFSAMNKTFNPRFAVNEFNYSYKNYQSLKENEEPNSADTVHGESRWTFFNKMVENKKEVAIEWTRDAFLIESNRRKAIEISPDTASQNDDTLFCIDTVNTTENRSFSEATELQHTYNSENGKLTLKNKGDVNFVLLGIEVGTVFEIKAPDANHGSYLIDSVSNNELILLKNGSFTISAAGDGARITAYSYTLNISSIPFTNYTNQDFSLITNLNTPDSYSNLRYSVRRNINNYWQSYLATCNLYHKEKNILNTWYKNNGECTTVYLGDTVREKSDLLPSNPILSPFLYNDIVFANVELEEFIALQTAIRSQRGFIRTIDNNERVLKVFPIMMKWEVLSKELTIKAEEKHEPKTMEINTANGFILINNETRVLNLKYEITDNKVSLFDANRQRLYNSVFWNTISINGSLSDTIQILEQRLELL